VQSWDKPFRSVSGACVIERCSPWSVPFLPSLRGSLRFSVHWFTGTTAQSDFSSTCMSAVGYGLCGPVLFFRTRRTRDLRFSCMLFLSVRGSQTTQDRTATREIAWLPCCLPPSRKDRHPDPSAFRSSIAPPLYLWSTFTRHLTVPLQDSSQMESLFSFPVGLFHPYKCRLFRKHYRLIVSAGWTRTQPDLTEKPRRLRHRK